METKHYKNILFFIALLYLVLSVIFQKNLQAQTLLVEYQDLSPNIFSSLPQPVGLSIFPFIQNGMNSDVTEKFYEQLISQQAIHQKFLIYPYTTIKEQLGIRTLDPENMDLLSKIRKNLNISLVVYGTFNIDDISKFTLIIVNTLNGEKEYIGDFRNSDSSDAVTDAVKLFTEDKVPSYTEVGVLNLQLDPEDCNVIIDGIIHTKLDNIILSVGQHILEIKYTGCEPLTEQIFIEPSQKFTKTYKLQRQFGNLNVIVEPENANIILMSDGKRINSWVGNQVITNLPVNTYEINCSLFGYESLKKPVNILPNRTIYEQITMKPDNSSLPLIRCEYENVRDLRVKYAGQDINLMYDLLGEEDEEYEVTLVVKNKQNSSEFEAKSVLGDIGDDVKTGVDKKIIWKVDNDLFGRLTRADYELELQVEETGGIAWYVWVGGGLLAFGGASAIIVSQGGLGGGDDERTPIGEPPGRP